MVDRKQLTCNSFVFYGSFYEAISVLPLENQARIYDAIFKFAFENIEVDLDGVELAVYLLIKPQLVANRAKYENGCKGGRPRRNETETQPNGNQNESECGAINNLSETEQKPNDNLNETKAKPQSILGLGSVSDKKEKEEKKKSCTKEKKEVRDKNQVSKKENKEINNNQPREGVYTRESYQDIMDNLMVEETVRPTLWSFIQHCQLNRHTLTNQKLTDILLQMDNERLSDKEKISKLKEAINGGYYDIKRGG